jgi:hypothetical protein
MAKIATGILVFRKSKCTDWTSDIDNQMNAWVQQYMVWAETAKLALDEASSGKSVTKYIFFPGSKHLMIISTKQQSWFLLFQPTRFAQAPVERH